jgi:PPM family protein phosphatase
MILMQLAVSCVRRSAKRRRGERMKAVFKTDKGKVRPHNEDNGGIFVNKNGMLLAVVADGMGGHLAGDVASKMTISHIQTYWEETEQKLSPNGAEQWFHEKISTINELLFQHAQENKECQGMGTTFVGAICGETYCTIGHIGDSRCYVLNNNGLTQITEDHSLVNELVRSGQITKKDAEHHPRKNVLLRALGTEKKVQLDVKTITFENNDILLLCSDGLSNKVSEIEMTEILSSSIPIEEKAEKLIDLANSYGGEDNISLAIVEYASGSESR